VTEAPGRATFRDVFAVAEFRALWFAELLSIFGDQLARVALSILVFEKTNSAALTGLTYALTYAPTLFGGIFLSPIADRLPRREVMFVVDLVRAILIAAAAFPEMPLGVLWGLVGLVSLINPPFKAAQLALMPEILAGDRYITGMAIRSMTIQTAQMAGFAGGGLLLIAVDPHIGLGIDALTFLASALFVRFGLKYRPAATNGTNRVPFMKSISQGGRLLFADRGLRTLLLFTWFLGLLPVYEGLAAPYAAGFDGGSEAVGLLLASDPLGSVIGAFVFTRFVRPEMRPKLVGVLSVIAAAILLICFTSPGLIVSMLLFMAGGALGTAALMQATASLSLAVPDSSRAQAMGLSNTGLTTATGLSPALGGLLADQTGAANTVAFFGVLGLVLAVPLALMWRKLLRSEPQRWLPGDTTPTTQS
jgi:predicted MFS family arabinose efflux permease